jgi:sugar phosphate isomerase/epimerase
MHVQGWSAETRKIAAVGQGTLDWKKIFAAAKTGGIKNWHVEMNLELMKDSVPYLRALEVTGVIQEALFVRSLFRPV